MDVWVNVEKREQNTAALIYFCPWVLRNNNFSINIFKYFFLVFVQASRIHLQRLSGVWKVLISLPFLQVCDNVKKKQKKEEVYVLG